MKPLSALPCDGVRGLIFDVDDTVTRDGRLERVAFDAMWSLADAGLVLVAVTGRPLGWADVIARQWPVALAVGENGAGWSWVDARHHFHVDYFEAPTERERSDALKQRALERVRAEMPHVQPARDIVARRCDLALDVGEEVSLAPGEIAQIVALIEAEGCRAPVSSVHCHIVPGPWDKASGAARAIEEVLGDFDDERWIFVGDSGNDADAFARFRRSVGVANVRAHLPRLPAPPAYITPSDRGRGFAELAQHLLGALRGVGRSDA